MGFLSDNEGNFLQNQQSLALHVAKLPILRKEYLEAQKKVEDGYLGNCQRQRDEYNHCVQLIQALARAM